MTGRNWSIIEALVDVLREWDCSLDEAKALLKDAAGEYEGYMEQQYERQQERMAGGDSPTYRRDMKNAGRGRLLR